jgi:hypothetical protein
MTEARRTAACRHGDHTIYQRPGQDWWEDEDGWTTCVKAAEIGPENQVGHQPMPAPLTGSQQ